MSRTSQQWWDETKISPEKIENWLKNQFLLIYFVLNSLSSICWVKLFLLMTSRLLFWKKVSIGNKSQMTESSDSLSTAESNVSVVPAN